MTGCASISSEPAAKASEGLVYYLPKKDVLVTVVKETKGKAVTTSVTIASTAALPDTQQAYAINFNRNWVGKNAMNIGISPTGLLSTAKSTSTSGVADALKNLAESAGMLAGPGLAAAPLPPPPCADGTHTFLYTVEPGAKANACDLKVTIERIAAAVPAGTPTGAASSPSLTGGSREGIYYRQEEAFKVTADGPGVKVTAIVLSPSLSPTRFLPMAKSFFGSATADFGFSDGMPTKFDQDADGELIALLKLPADVIGAYFGAVGKLFDSFKTRDTKEAEVLAASTKAELARKKYEACIEAIKSKDDTLIAKLGCGT
ncbi:hypothetical protein EXH46_26480 [Pelomonas puraquae]|uniref:Uncharacterized protein n=2 Tax=Roseateles puraquae TaxID=431059 RepID=A0A254N3A4_9BURK|nr:hypothetical protein [Roseateles puraquae]OWR02310.1 hypothetical protein CDO81_20330 [Roseateles puraquae]